MPIAQAAEPGDGQIEFAEPTDWRCTNKDGCVVCWNVGERPGRLVFKHTGGKREAHDVAAGDALSVCPP